MESIYRLRKLSKKVVDCRWQVEFDRAIEALEAAIAERYMELPLDADGEPIHIHDEVQYLKGGGMLPVVEVYAVSPNSVYYHDSEGIHGVYADFCHHVKPRTIEDVLADMQQDTLTSQGEYSGEVIEADEWKRQLEESVKSYAAEIRELMEVEQ